MKKLKLIAFTNILQISLLFFFSENIYSQISICDNLLSGYPVVDRLAQQKIDSTTFITTAIITEKGKQVTQSFISQYDFQSKTFITEKLHLSEEEAWLNCQTLYFKESDQIYRIRPEEKKGEIYYFKDKIIEKNIINATTPFLSGSRNEGYSLNMHLFEMKNHYVFITINTDFENVGFMFNCVNKTDFKFLSKKSMQFKHKMLGSTLNTVQDNKQIIIDYTYIDDKKYKINTLVWDQNECINFIFTPKFDAKIKKTSVFLQNGEIHSLIFFGYQKDNNIFWETTLLTIDNIKKTQIETSNKNIPILTKKMKEEFNICRYELGEIIYDNNFSYIIICASSSVEGKPFYDFLISKIENNKIIWNKYVIRDKIDESKTYDNGKIINRKFPTLIEQNEQLLTLGYLKDGITIKVLINKETGEISPNGN